jgi:hypothetical protein
MSEIGIPRQLRASVQLSEGNRSRRFGSLSAKGTRQQTVQHRIRFGNNKLGVETEGH